ncbi:MAG: hypothetical protein ACYDAQ_03330 [Mycobacteriales bacterium]
MNLSTGPQRLRRAPAGARIAVALAFLAATAACAGPLEPLNVQTQALPIGLVLGQHAAVVTAPLAPITLPPQPVSQLVFHPGTSSGVGPASAPTAERALTAIPKLAPCPLFNPLAPIGVVPTTTSGPPAATRYVYRSAIASTAGATKQTYAGATTWTVSKASAPNMLGDYTFQVQASVPQAGFSKTTTYEVVPTGVQAAGQQVPPGNVGGNPAGVAPTSAPIIAAPEQPGIYLDGVTESMSSGSSSFLPTSPIPLVQFPIQIGASFTTSGTDGNSTLAYTSTVTRQTKVNACGTPVGAWEVDLTNGRVSSAGQPTVDFTETLDIATEAGGLVAGDSYSSSGSQLPAGMVSLNESDTIDSPPRAAG